MQYRRRRAVAVAEAAASVHYNVEYGLYYARAPIVVPFLIISRETLLDVLVAWRLPEDGSRKIRRNNHFNGVRTGILV
jgi:hypothetical protein